jgi:hypothetical protein
VAAVTPEHWKRVAELFEAAVEHEPAARAEFLAKAAAGAASLAQEVLRLLASDENAGTFMSTPPGLGSLPASDGHLAAKLESLRKENPSLATEMQALLSERHALGDTGFVKTSALRSPRTRHVESVVQTAEAVRSLKGENTPISPTISPAPTVLSTSGNRTAPFWR